MKILIYLIISCSIHFSVFANESPCFNTTVVQAVNGLQDKYFPQRFSDIILSTNSLSQAKRNEMSTIVQSLSSDEARLFRRRLQDAIEQGQIRRCN